MALVDATDGLVFCTGTLIGERAVITAAHCLVQLDENEAKVVGTRSTESLVVVGGVLDVAQATSAQRHTVARLIAHPSFAPQRSTLDEGMHDVGVVLLRDPIHDIAPVATLSADELEEELAVGDELVLEGYGTSDAEGRAGAGVLRTATVPVIEIGTRELIAGEHGTADSCAGDSGGPLYVELAGARSLAGVISRARSTANARCGDGGIYTLVPTEQSFIDAAIAGRIPESESADDAGGSLDTATTRSSEATNPDADERAAGCTVTTARASSAASRLWTVPLLLLAWLSQRRRTRALGVPDASER